MVKKIMLGILLGASGIVFASEGVGITNVGSDFFYSYYNYVDGNFAKVYQVSSYTYFKKGLSCLKS